MSKVSRSVYQKLAEENKRLMKDIKTLTTGPMLERIKLKIKWANHFKQRDDLNAALKAVAQGYFKEHPAKKP